MPSISPLFFTYYGPNSYNKDWIYVSTHCIVKSIALTATQRSDDWLLARRFEQLIAMRTKIDMAEMVTWNGERNFSCSSCKMYSSYRLRRVALCRTDPRRPAQFAGLGQWIPAHGMAPAHQLLRPSLPDRVVPFHQL